MREVTLCRTEAVDLHRKMVIDFVEENRRRKKNVYQTYIRCKPDNSLVVLQTTAKDLHLGFGRMDLQCQQAFAGVLLDELRSAVQVILDFEGGEEKGEKSLLVTKLSDEFSTIFKFELV